MKTLHFILFFILFSTSLQGNTHDALELQEIPTSFKGRFRPLDTSARLWLEENYHRQTIKSSHINDFRAASPSALSLLWKLQFHGYQNWSDVPLFWIYSADLKKMLNLPLQNNYFSYDQLYHAIYEQKESNLTLVKELITYQFLKDYSHAANRTGTSKLELKQLSPELWTTLKQDQIVILSSPSAALWQQLHSGFIVSPPIQTLPHYIKEHRKLNDEILHLLQLLHQFSLLNGPTAEGQKDYENAYQELATRRMAPGQISELLEREFPLNQRLSQAGTIFKVLPGKNGEWYSLNALTLKNYDQETNRLVPIHNFTVYRDEQFEKIRSLYLKLINDYTNKEDQLALANLLIDNYNNNISHQTAQKAWGKTITYPSANALKLEYWYYQLPLTESAIIFYALAIIFFLINMPRGGKFFLLIAFSLNTLILAIRCYILDRPPVSNMFETVIYVPWVAVVTSLLLSRWIKNTWILLGSSLIALLLLIVLKAAGLGDSMENVQAVLDSQYWLIIHVLLIVGSYGVFALGGVLGQIYLTHSLIYSEETVTMKELGKAILQTMYIGLAMLIPGTILGGVWAAQSWGRFWDWDPKESWAFISSCLYLIFIHAYTFKHIRMFGLAMGSILGLLAISFTWYGVNYILGTGLHSYGFGSGGEIYYYLFLFTELLFLSTVGYFHWRKHRIKSFDQK